MATNPDDDKNAVPPDMVFQLSPAPLMPLTPPAGDGAELSLVARLCELLKDQDLARRYLAMNALVELGPEAAAAVPHLIPLLEHPSEATRRSAAAVLGQIGQAAQTAVPALHAALKENNDTFRRWVAYALAELGPAAKEAVPDLLELRTGSPDIRTRAVAAVAVRRIDPEAGAGAVVVRQTEQPGEACRFYGHQSWVQSVAFAPDGRFALSGSGQPGGSGAGGADFSVRLWDLVARREVQCLSGHVDRVMSVAIFPDGRRGVSGSCDETVRVWDLETGKQLRCLQGHEDRVRSVAASPNGRHVLSGGCDQTLRLWDVETGREVHRFRKHEHWVISVAFSRDGALAMSGSLDGTVRLWDVGRGKQMGGHALAAKRRWPWSWLGRRDPSLSDEPAHPASSVAFSPDSKLALCGSMDKMLRLWDLHTNEDLRQVAGHTAGVTSVAFAPDGARVLSGSMDHTLRLWDVATGKELHCFEGHADVVTSVAISPDGRLALSGSADKTVRLWRLPE